jgi:hypothetical protein
MTETALSLRASFRALIWRGASTPLAHGPASLPAGLILILDADAVLTRVGIPDSDPVMLMDALANLSRWANVRVAVILRGVIHRLQGHNFNAEGRCASDQREDVADAISHFAREIGWCALHVGLYVTGQDAFLLSTTAEIPYPGPGGAVRGAIPVTMRVGPRRAGADYVLPTVPALARFVALLDREFQAEAEARGRDLPCAPPVWP